MAFQGRSKVRLIDCALALNHSLIYGHAGAVVSFDGLNQTFLREGGEQSWPTVSINSVFDVF